jgi:DNA-binding protein Fis
LIIKRIFIACLSQVLKEYIKNLKKIDVENVLFYQSVKSEIEIPYIRAAEK